MKTRVCHAGGNGDAYWAKWDKNGDVITYDRR